MISRILVPRRFQKQNGFLGGFKVNRPFVGENDRRAHTITDADSIVKNTLEEKSITSARLLQAFGSPDKPVEVIKINELHQYTIL